MSGRRPSSIATRTGDSGTTSLLYGQRVPKDHPQVEAVGALDEFNAALGTAKATRPPSRDASPLEHIQRDLIALMGEVSCAEADVARHAASRFARIGETELARLDEAVAALEDRGLKFDGWATPGATPYAAALEVARTTARRAERRLAGLAGQGRVLRPVLLQYVNRASDLLWLMAREAENTGQD
ncbi:MAG TPA: cob(I)yrinic acid a,c-diamide adenosyltransferase [Lacunisphaera sp.]|nr:cob(I)yrinic acid a,c-diamide adenosyltransferase [Lacunisphaera sp.]